MRSNYLQMYIYRLKRKHRKEFLRIQQEAAKIYSKYGAGEEEMFLLHDGRPVYGLKGIGNLLPTTKGEELWIGITRYKNAQQCKRVMTRINEDPEIDVLFQRAVRLLHPMSRHVRGEFEKSALSRSSLIRARH